MQTILVVDDESASLRLVTQILAPEGYRVCPADSAALALSSVASQSPDLILVDVGMPGMNGFEFCRRLKARKESAAIPVIFVSGSTDTKAPVEGLALGAVDFIAKPFRREELLARVQTHLELSRLRGDLEAQVAERTAELGAAIVRLQHEIADRTQAEEALKESEQRFRNMADTSPVLIWVAGPDKLCTFLSKSWLDFTGRTMEQESGFGWAQSVHPQDRDRCLAIYSSSFDMQRPFKMEYRLRRSDGDYRWVVAEGVPRMQPVGGFLGYIGSCVDITDIRKAQEETFGRDRVESLRVLAGGIAHDFTNLMGALLAAAEVAETETPEGSSAREEIQTIKIVAKRAVEMARELMIYADRDKGNVELLDLSQLVEDMAAILATSISKCCVLIRDLPKDLPDMWGNPTHMRQVIMNLIINASEAIGETGGTIHIRASSFTHEQQSDSKRANMLPDGDYLKLEVSDSGCGMTDEQRMRIFDPIFTTKGKGHGLGLAVVQGIVDSHSGVINVMSTPGQGTTFEILLPCVQKPAG